MSANSNPSKVPYMLAAAIVPAVVYLPFIYWAGGDTLSTHLLGAIGYDSLVIINLIIGTIAWRRECQRRQTP